MEQIYNNRTQIKLFKLQYMWAATTDFCFAIKDWLQGGLPDSVQCLLSVKESITDGVHTLLHLSHGAANNRVEHPHDTSIRFIGSCTAQHELYYTLCTLI